MPTPIFKTTDRVKSIATIAVIASIVAPSIGLAGGVTGEATEFTQIANNTELISLVGKSAE